jgi:drug/metabolite transporter (DMT)-like permease
LKRNNLAAQLQVLFAITVWAMSFITTKLVLLQISPITMVWLRFSIGLVVLALAGVLQKQLARPSLKDLGYFALLGAVGISLHQWMQSHALVTSQAVTSGFIVATIPVYMALMGWAILGEKMGPLRWAGIFTATCGVLLVVTRGDPASLLSGHIGAPGDILVLLSAVIWAGYSILSSGGLKRFSALNMLFYVMACAWVFNTALLFAAGPGFSELGNLNTSGWLGIAFLGVLCSGLAFLFWYGGLKSMPASQAGAYLYLEPLITMASAALVLGERLRPLGLAGGGIILLGVWMVNRRQAGKISPAGQPE